MKTNLYWTVGGRVNVIQKLESRIKHLLEKRDYLLEEGNKEALNDCVEDIVVLDWIKEVVKE